MIAVTVTPNTAVGTVVRFFRSEHAGHPVAWATRDKATVRATAISEDDARLVHECLARAAATTELLRAGADVRRLATHTRSWSTNMLAPIRRADAGGDAA